MKLNDLNGAEKGRSYSRQKRVGRGDGNNWGRTCGRGEKGQLSRSGATRRPHFEGGQIPLFRRLPKRGFKSRNPKSYVLMNVDQLEKAFDAGEKVTLEALAAKGMITKRVGDGLKILGNGEISKKLTVVAQACSESAKAKIEKAGGSIELVPLQSNEIDLENVTDKA